MLTDFTTIEAQTLLGFGRLYWLISNGDRHRPEVLAEVREPVGPLDRVP
jgi:hypothetical protein